MARSILREEGVRGLYRGFNMSVATFVPSSAIWWSAYGIYTKLLAPLLPRPAPAPPAAPAAPAQAVAAHPSQQAAFMAAAARRPKEGGQDAVAAMAGGQQQGVKGWQVAVLQVSASVLAGATSSLLTNPLDLIKTRIQVARKAEGQACTARSVVQEVLRQDGPLGLFRGVLPRMASAALWGTCMVTVYEFLKRISKRTDPDISLPVV
ncbi:mitochondrial carrier domain-containing protein [Haematococcus lacustris]